MTTTPQSGSTSSSALSSTATGIARWQMPALVIGILVRTASVCGLIFMLALLFSSNYPGAGAPLWQYFGASLNHLVLAMCFAAFVFGEADQVASLRAYLRRLRRATK